MYKLFSNVGIGPTRVDVCGYKGAGSDDSKEVGSYVPPPCSVDERKIVQQSSTFNQSNMMEGDPITRPGLSRSKSVVLPSVQSVAATVILISKAEEKNQEIQDSISAFPLFQKVSQPLAQLLVIVGLTL